MKLEFDPQALTDLYYWAVADRAKATRIIALLDELEANPARDSTPLRGALAGFASRRIDLRHRLVFAALRDRIVVLSCRYHD